MNSVLENADPQNTYVFSPSSVGGACIPCDGGLSSGSPVEVLKNRNGIRLCEHEAD